MDEQLLQLCVAASGAEALWITDADGAILWKFVRGSLLPVTTGPDSECISDIVSAPEHRRSALKRVGSPASFTARGRRVRLTAIQSRNSFGGSTVFVYAIFRRGAKATQALRAAGLTAAEVSVARLVGKGVGTAATASRLKISAATVRSHLRAVYAKLDVHTRSELVDAFTNHLLR